MTSIRKRKRKRQQTCRRPQERVVSVLASDALQAPTNPQRGGRRSHPPRVVVDPEVMWGIPCLAGSRLPARTLLGMVDGGDAWERIVDSWPWLTPAHVAAARCWLAAGEDGERPREPSADIERWRVREVRQVREGRNRSGG